METVSLSLSYLYFHLLQRLCDLLQLSVDLHGNQTVHVRVLHPQALHDALVQRLLGAKLAVDLLKVEKKKINETKGTERETLCSQKHNKYQLFLLLHQDVSQQRRNKKHL